MCGCDVANGINVHFGCITNDAFGKMINSAAVDLLLIMASSIPKCSIPNERCLLPNAPDLGEIRARQISTLDLLISCEAHHKTLCFMFLLLLLSLFILHMQCCQRER